MYKLVVLLSVVALAVAKPSVVAPLTYTSVVPAVSSQYSSVVHGSPVYTPSFYNSYVNPYLYPAFPLSQAPNSPAVVLDGVNGVPLDTPEVVAARAAHYNAKALSGVHHLRKRSVVTPIAYTSVSPVHYTSPFVSTYDAAVVSPYTYPYYPKAYGVHPW